MSTAETPPASASTPQPSDDDIAACAPDKSVRSATTAIMLAGVTTAANGLQLVTSLRFDSALPQASLYMMVAAGVGAVFVGFRLYRMHGWAAWASTYLATLLTLGMGLWLVFALMNGLFTCFALFAPPLAAVAAFYGYRAMPAVRRASEVRARLEDAGIDLGF